MTQAHYVKSHADVSSEGYQQAMSLIGKLDLELTERCNNNCVHCYINLPQHDRDARSREMPTDRVIAVLDEAATLGCLTVRFTGGEPLLREDFDDVYLAARRLGLRVLLFTNATLLTSETIDMFKQFRPLEPIEVSIYGMTRSSYEAVTRTAGSFDRAMFGISLLREAGIPYVVKWISLPHNRHEQEEYRRFAAGIPWMGRNANMADVSFYYRARRDDPGKNMVIASLREEPARPVNRSHQESDAFHQSMREYCRRFVRDHPGDRLFGCRAGNGGCVDAYGMYQPCLLLRHPSTTCDLENHSLSHALTEFFPAVLQMKARNPEFLNRCGRCFIRELCEQCPAKSWMEHGTLDTPVEYECRLAHAQARQMGLLADDESAPEVTDGVARIQAYINGDTA